MNWHDPAKKENVWQKESNLCNIITSLTAMLNGWRTSRSVLILHWPLPAVHQFSFDTYLQPCCSLMHEASLPPAPTTTFFPDTATALKVGEWNALKEMSPTPPFPTKPAPAPQLWDLLSSRGKIMWVIITVYVDIWEYENNNVANILRFLGGVFKCNPVC